MAATNMVGSHISGSDILSDNNKQKITNHRLFFIFRGQIFIKITTININM